MYHGASSRGKRAKSRSTIGPLLPSRFHAGDFLSILFIFCLLAAAVIPIDLRAQCCSAGSGSPIAGGSSQGVLSEHQLELSVNFQYINSSRFLAGSNSAPDFLDNFHSSYLYTRVAFGVTADFTLSIESGYWPKKSQVGLNAIDTNATNGFGDLILFPRYDVINHTEENNRTELTIGLGYKIPLGPYTDSLRRVEPFSGEVYFQRMPLAVQPSTGAHDVIFYGFFYRGFPDDNINFFSNLVYIKKGWNELGEKMGDYASIGLFANTLLFKTIGATLQVRGEWIDQMRINQARLLYDYPNYDPEATGSKKVFVTPQLSYSFDGELLLYAMAEIPVYQYVNKSQIASQHQFTFGIAYRFYVVN